MIAEEIKCAKCSGPHCVNCGGTGILVREVCWQVDYSPLTPDEINQKDDELSELLENSVPVPSPDLANMTHAEQMILLINNIHRPEVVPMADAILLFKQTQIALANAYRVLAEVRRDFPNLVK